MKNLKTVMIAAVTGVICLSVAALAQVFTALPTVGTLTGAEIFAAVQSAVTKQVTLSQITAYVQAQMGGSATPTGPAGGDLSGTYPNPTVAKVDGVAYPTNPSTNTVPVVTGANTVTYQQVAGAQIATNTVTNTNLAQAAANTMKGNWTASTANEADNTMPTCADSGGNHLNYVNGTGITCGTSSGGSSGAAAPQGRLTLATGTPVMTTTQSAKTTVFLDC